MTQISPMLAIGGGNGKAAIAFYQAAFGASVRWQIDAGGHVVAGLTIDGAELFLADESPPSTRGPAEAGTTTVRIELFVDDPAAVHARAIAAGAAPRSAVVTHEHPLVDGGVLRMVQGSVTDPFGHVWLLGKFLAA